MDLSPTSRSFRKSMSKSLLTSWPNIFFEAHVRKRIDKFSHAALFLAKIIFKGTGQEGGTFYLWDLFPSFTET